MILMGCHPSYGLSCTSAGSGDKAMGRMIVIFAVAAFNQAAIAQIYKCTEVDGRVIFAQIPCTTVTGSSEHVEVTVNEVGSLATESEIEKLRQERNSPKSGLKVKTIYDSSNEDQRTHEGRVNRRLRESQEQLNEIEGGAPSLREPVPTHEKIRRIRDNERSLEKHQ